MRSVTLFLTPSETGHSHAALPRCADGPFPLRLMQKPTQAATQ